MLLYLKTTPDRLQGKVAECSCMSCNTSMIVNYMKVWLSETDETKSYFVFCDYTCALKAFNAHCLPRA